jgi:hypothetical protein
MCAVLMCRGTSWTIDLEYLVSRNRKGAFVLVREETDRHLTGSANDREVPFVSNRILYTMRGHRKSQVIGPRKVDSEQS